MAKTEVGVIDNGRVDFQIRLKTDLNTRLDAYVDGMKAQGKRVSKNAVLNDLVERFITEQDAERLLDERKAAK